MNYRNKKNAEAISKFYGKSLHNPDWYTIKAETDSAEIMIYDALGWPFIEASQFIKDLQGIKAPTITVRINSPGGDLYEGISVANALKSHPARIVTRIEGVAASIASVIAMAGDERQAYDNTMLMLHNAWVLVAGNKNDLRNVANTLEKVDGQLAGTYTEATGLPASEIQTLMDAETWLTAKEAKAQNFIDTVLDGNGEPIKAAFDLSIFNNAPAGIKSEKKNVELTKREIEAILRDAGASRSFAKSIAAGRGANSETSRDAEAEEVIKNLINTLKEK